MMVSMKTSTKILQAMLFCGMLMIFAATAQAAIAPTAPPGFPASMINCGMCHGLTVNGIVITTGGGFVATVTGRDAATWGSTITRMINQNFCPFPAGDTTALASYLASVGTATTTTIKKKRDCDDRSDDRSGHRRGHHKDHRDHRSDDCRDDRSDDHSGKHK